MNTARFTTLHHWLSWQQNLHPHSVDLGLERLTQVMTHLALAQPAHPVITVGGTNGKGSSVAFLEAMLRAGGYRVGVYTSPHLLHYNERIRIDGNAVTDEALCRAFARIDAARGDISLTYFEFGTLAAFDIFQHAALDVAVLEVGLGGRLDAVNALDADTALVTGIALDHTEWLGPDRESIGFEKAGIYRSGRPAICADPEPPASLLKHARAIGAELYCYGQDYHSYPTADGWDWECAGRRLQALPRPALVGEHQRHNAAAALMALHTLAARLPLSEAALRAGIRQARLPGRFQVIPGTVEWVLDVAHNPQGVTVLAQCLRERPCAGRTHAVLGMLADKDAAGVAQALAGVVHQWYPATLAGARGRTGSELATALQAGGATAPMQSFATVQDACQAAQQSAAMGDRIVVFGSFYTVAAAMRFGVGRVNDG